MLLAPAMNQEMWNPIEAFMRVLLVEDNADIAANIIDYLEADGYEPDHARDGLVRLDA